MSPSAGSPFQRCDTEQVPAAEHVPATVQIAATVQVSAVLVIDAHDRVLAVRKRGTTRFMQPGGKPEHGENPVETALRELQEEIGLILRGDHLIPLGRFSAEAANEPHTTVVSDVFLAEMTEDADAILETLGPAAEIEELRWLPLDGIREAEHLAPLMTTQIVPALRRRRQIPSPRVLVIQHEHGVGADRFGEWMRQAGAELVVLRPDRGDPVPTTLAGFHGLLVLGGTAGPEDDEQWPWLPAVRTLQRSTAAAAFPSFNICLGAQLSAVASGTEVFRRRIPQVGVMELQRRAEAAADPVFSAMPARARAVLWHQEQIAAVPHGAVHLVEGTDAPVQAFRWADAAWSVQFHPEPHADTVRSWAASTAGLIERAGSTPEAVLADYTAYAEQIEADFRPVATAFVDYLRTRELHCGRT